MLSKSRYVTGSTLTEADIRLFCVLIRFDPVYALLFCTKKRVVGKILNSNLDASMVFVCRSCTCAIDCDIYMILGYCTCSELLHKQDNKVAASTFYHFGN